MQHSIDLRMVGGNALLTGDGSLFHACNWRATPGATAGALDFLLRLKPQCVFRIVDGDIILYDSLNMALYAVSALLRDLLTLGDAGKSVRELLLRIRCLSSPCACHGEDGTAILERRFLIAVIILGRMRVLDVTPLQIKQ